MVVGVAAGQVSVLAMVAFGQWVWACRAGACVSTGHLCLPLGSFVVAAAVLPGLVVGVVDTISIASTGTHMMEWFRQPAGSDAAPIMCACCCA